ncbi:MAG: hypothetical protein AB1405_03200 [Bdellovibrionota bacterium]
MSDPVYEARFAAWNSEPVFSLRKNLSARWRKVETLEEKAEGTLRRLKDPLVPGGFFWRGRPGPPEVREQYLYEEKWARFCQTLLAEICRKRVDEELEKLRGKRKPICHSERSEESPSLPETPRLARGDREPPLSKEASPWPASGR